MAQDLEAQSNDLVVQYLPLVRYAVHELLTRIPQHVDRGDLTSCGHLALIKAARAYDPTLGVPFARYASLRIRGALIDELRSLDWVTRGVRGRAKATERTAAAMTSELRRAPTTDELAAALGLSASDVERARATAALRPCSLDALEGVGARDMILDGGPTPEQALAQAEELDFLRASVQSLPERLQFVINGSFFRDRSDDELAVELGVSSSRISQLRSEALSLLRGGLHASLDPDLLAPSDNPGGVKERRRLAFYASVAARVAANARYAQAGVLPTQREHASTPGTLRRTA
jgi:RNA polymerase sigma factor for flagellar operon FliA